MYIYSPPSLSKNAHRSKKRGRPPLSLTQVETLAKLR